MKEIIEINAEAVEENQFVRKEIEVRRNLEHIWRELTSGGLFIFNNDEQKTTLKEIIDDILKNDSKIQQIANRLVEHELSYF